MTDYLGPYELGPGGDFQGILNRDASMMCDGIPNDSVRLIFTDPIYDRIEDYDWLARLAARVLTSDGHLLVYVTQAALQEQLAAISPHLVWGWLFGIQLFGRRAPLWSKKVQMCGQLIAWFTKSKAHHHGWVDDFRGVNARQHNGHEWRKEMEQTVYYIEALTNPSDIVLDPFTGGGTIPVACKMLGRRYLAFEIGPEVAEMARQRVRDTPSPLFTMPPEQPRLLVDD